MVIRVVFVLGVRVRAMLAGVASPDGTNACAAGASGARAGAASGNGPIANGAEFKLFVLALVSYILLLLFLLFVLLHVIVS